MVKLTEHGVVLAADGTFAAAEDALQKAEGKEKNMAYGILKAITTVTIWSSSS